MEQQSELSTEAPQKAAGLPARLLIVDDERSMRELLSIVLRREGYDVTLAENGRTAVDALERGRYDLLISDIKMPDMSGVDVLRAVFKLIEQIARTDSTVLVTGESGTGKEWVARAIHFYSLRRERPFVALNCGALPENLLESELFGYMKGAFTGANANKKGLIEAAEKGTLFLDEIGEHSHP